MLENFNPYSSQNTSQNFSQTSTSSTPPKEVNLEGKSYKCPSCGSYLLFRKGRLVCDYCNYQTPLHYHPHPVEYTPFVHYPVAEEKVNVKCPSCGATSPLPERGIAMRCPYCKAPLLGEFFNPLKPPVMVPFSLSPQEAYQKGVEFLKSGFFVYGSFKKELQKYKEVTSYYYPMWLFNLNCYVQYRGERGEVEYEYIERSGKMERYEKVKWYPVEGALDLKFRNIGYIGYFNRRSDQIYLSRMQWNLAKSVQFQWEPLAGSEGYEYKIDNSTALKIVQGSLEGRIRNAIRRDIGGDRQRIWEYTKEWFDIQNGYLLVPVFHFSVKWRGKEYNVYINGDTGEVTGQKPINKVLVFFVVLIVAILIGVGIYYYNQYMGGNGGGW